MPAKGQVFGIIESAILTGGFKQGEMLPPERALAQRYKVTRTTIRRALIKLCGDGLIENYPRIGYRVVSSIRNGQARRLQIVGLLWRNAPLAKGSSYLLAKLESSLAESGHALMIANTGYDTEKENEAICRLRAAGVNAIIIAPARQGNRSTELEKWIIGRQPVVLHGHPRNWCFPEKLIAGCDMVDADNRQGIKEVMNLLYVSGHKTVGYVSSEPTDGSERYQAFLEFGKEYGLRIEPRWVVNGQESGVTEGQAAAAQLLACPPLPTAIVCSHDKAAIALISALQERGIRCPEDISVTGCDNDSHSDGHTEPTLTTVDFDIDHQVAEMVRLLAKQFSGDSEHPEHIRVPARLVLRRTVCPPRQV